MIYLKEANCKDFQKEYEYISSLASEENGFTNDNYGCTEMDFKKVLQNFIDNSKGINLKTGRVPMTHFFLWEDDTIIGLFRIRHCLNDFLREGPGHISYGIKEEYRGKGYGTEGLRLAIEIAKKIVPENEIFMCVEKQNIPSLKVQIKNGAYIHHESDEEYFTRIPLM